MRARSSLLTYGCTHSTFSFSRTKKEDGSWKENLNQNDNSQKGKDEGLRVWQVSDLIVHCSTHKKGELCLCYAISHSEKGVAVNLKCSNQNVQTVSCSKTLLFPKYRCQSRRSVMLAAAYYLACQLSHTGTGSLSYSVIVSSAWLHIKINLNWSSRPEKLP